MKRFLLLIACLSLASSASAQTRLYFTEATTAAVTPAPDAAWGRTTDVVYRKLNDTKGSSTLADGTLISVPAFTTTAERMYVSTRMAAGITFDTSTTGTMYLQVKKAGAGALVQAVAASFSIVSEDGLTVRFGGGVSTGAFSEYPTTMTSREIFNATNMFGSSYTTVTGDRLVMEFGHYDGTGGSSTTASSRWGENGTDLSGAGSTSTTVNPWFEFSNTITFIGEPAATASKSLMLLGTGN
jgi:hypothetical protein